MDGERVPNDGQFVPWAERDQYERRTLMLVHLLSGTAMEDSPAVITDADRDHWRRLQADVDRIHAAGRMVDIPVRGRF